MKSFFLKDTSLLLVLFMLMACASEINLQARTRIILSPTKPISAQISASDKGAIYIVQTNIDLKKNTVKMPQGSILQFEGGKLSNGEIVGNNATIEAGRYEIFDEIELSGTWLLDGVKAEWFGAIPNREDIDCSVSINKAIVNGKHVNASILLGSGIYYTKSVIDISDYGTLIGISSTVTRICFREESGIGVYMHGQCTTIKNISVQEYKMKQKGICIKLGDKIKRESCTRGYVEDIKTLGGDKGLDLEYQWCNKISGVNCRYSNIGLYVYATTPSIENAVIESNYQCGVYSDGSGIKLYNAIIEGNMVGCVLNGGENYLNNCYFEGNTATYVEDKPKKDKNGVDVKGGHLYVGEKKAVISLVMIGCVIGDVKKYNNTIRIDNCKGFTAMGCSSLKNAVITGNCIVKYVDEHSYTRE